MDSQQAIERIYREEYGRIVASLVRRFGDIDIAEEAAGEALLTAVEKWPVDGVPPNPGGWLTTTAGNRADRQRIRRESHRDAKHQAALMIEDDTPHEPTGLVEDDRLRLIFTCCHPARAPGAGGPDAAAARRPHRCGDRAGVPRPGDDDGPADHPGEKKISLAKIPYRVPSARDLPPRLSAVLPSST